MTPIEDVLKNGTVYYLNDDDKLTDIDVTVSGELYPLNSKHNSKSIFNTKPAKGVLEIGVDTISILNANNETFKNIAADEIVGLHVSWVRRKGISAGLIHEPEDHFFTYLEVETKNDHYYFMNETSLLALKVLQLATHYPVVDELKLLKKFDSNLAGRELVEKINERGFETLAEATPFLTRVKSYTLTGEQN
ncbi:hypothetical protein EQG49_06525 [Periweissella cryptocerci]|uniref:Uncharacterized protein n=1 Tax=Periweissella cryptocerci TaxID=2506420 RepID=A0A4P6YTZ6_9LACO|nr:hypothetical protein [Periweissella cryptocerci]QBO36137.1 hypothetical protein EQG49_06525 [Periweissella cryptocerci]